VELDKDVKNGRPWYVQQHPDLQQHTIAYFSAEFGLHTSLPIYSGGLGVLSGDHIKEASDLGLPFVAIGFLYEQGYFRQRFDASGWQEAIYPPLNLAEAALRPARCAEGEGECLFTLRIGDRDVLLKVWETHVGRTRLYLMDANVEQNAPWDRQLTARLYGGDQEMRLQQEIILGIGGVKILRALGYNPRVWAISMKATRPFCAGTRREYVAQGLSFAEAQGRIRAGAVFTTHTRGPGRARHLRIWVDGKYFYPSGRS
jgi:starch phosphorylase